jgi:putative alpha-1,2-mannosidase
VGQMSAWYVLSALGFLPLALGMTPISLEAQSSTERAVKLDLKWRRQSFTHTLRSTKERLS